MSIEIGDGGEQNEPVSTVNEGPRKSNVKDTLFARMAIHLPTV